MTFRRSDSENNILDVVNFLFLSAKIIPITQAEMDTHRSIRKSESGINSDISGQPYCVSVLKEGYCTAEPDGAFRADGTISLITGPQTILVDNRGPVGPRLSRRKT